MPRHATRASDRAHRPNRRASCGDTLRALTHGGTRTHRTRGTTRRTLTHAARNLPVVLPRRACLHTQRRFHDHERRGRVPLRTLLTYRARRHDVNRATRLAVNQTSTRKHISARRRRRIRTVKHALASQRHRARSLGRGARGAIRSMHGRGATAQTDGALPNAARPTMPRAVAAPHQSSAE